MFNIIKKVIKYCIIIGLVYLAILYNFEANAVYYYQNSSKTDKEGTPFVLLNHLWWYRNGKWYQEGDYIYQLKGNAGIGFLNREEQEYYKFRQNTNYYNGFSVTISSRDILEKDYLFDSTFKLVEIFDHEFNNLPITKAEEKRARKAIEETTKQLMKEVEPPLINLQWLYDLTYYLRNGK